MQKLFLLLGLFYSCLVLSLDLKEIISTIAVDGNTGSFMIGSGVQITEDIVLSVNHLVTRYDAGYSPEKFKRNETIQKNPSYTENLSEKQQKCDEIEPVLLVNNGKNIFIIKKQNENYSFAKVLRVIPYDPNDLVESDPIKVLLLSFNKPHLAESLREKFFDEKWRGDKILPSLKLTFSYLDHELEPWGISDIFWERKETTFALLHPSGSEFFISPIQTGARMSGGGLFLPDGRLIGLLSGDIVNIEGPIGMAAKLSAYRNLFEKFSWEVNLHDESGKIYLKSNPGFHGATIKTLNFDDLQKALSHL